MKPAVVLLSGGLDSSTVLAVAVSEGFAAHALTIAYGQRHEVELQAAVRIANSLGAKSQKIVDIPLREFGGSALTGDIDVPIFGPGKGIPVTYVPARNTLFLALAVGYAEVLGAQDIFIGVSSVDYSGYPDCRPEFIEAFEALANVATKMGVEGRKITIHAPLMNLSKAQTIQLGIERGVDYALTHSCYDPNHGLACGRCDSCRIRAAGFAELGFADPALAHLQSK